MPATTRQGWISVSSTAVIAACIARSVIALAAEPTASPDQEPLCVVVMDPLAAQLSCPCVAGFAQRDYLSLGRHLEKALGRAVKIGFGESLARGTQASGCPRAHIVIGKHSVVREDGKAGGIVVEPLASLTDRKGSCLLYGLFVVPTDDPAESLEDLVDYTIQLGPKEHVEKHSMALEALRRIAASDHPERQIAASCSDAAAAILDPPPPAQAAAVISSYAQPLLEGCGTVPKGALRVVGKTRPVRFITAFVSGDVDFPTRDRVKRVLLDVGRHHALCAKLESSRGFVPCPDPLQSAWSGWRGPQRDGFVPGLPARLPEAVDRVWSRPLSRSGLGGVAATTYYVVIGDRDDDDRQDVFRCFDADTGRPLWTVAYDAPGELDYGNSPRATPLIENDRVHLFGAMGDLHCVALATGRVLWKRNLVVDFGVPKEALSAWGYCSSPLVVDGRLIVNPGAPDASIVAIDPATGAEVWRCPGNPAGHASCVTADISGIRQVIGYDNATLSGWDLFTGKRLWSLAPEVTGDFNVPTPVLVKDAVTRLLVATEMNGSRLHGFCADGTIDPKPLGQRREPAPDMATPVMHGHRMFCAQEKLFALDCTSRGLAEATAPQSGPFETYAAAVAGPASVLVIGNNGQLVMFDVVPSRREPTTLAVFEDASVKDNSPVFSHPAFVGTRMFIRGDNELICVELAEKR
jgi:ABC-type phosphate/phosphonate transport system substrate-binding protein